MQRGNLILYDENGSVWILEGEAEGDILQHNIPVGTLKVKELEYGQLNNVKKCKYTDSEGLEIIEIYEELLESDEINLTLLESEGVI